MKFKKVVIFLMITVILGSGCNTLNVEAESYSINTAENNIISKEEQIDDLYNKVAYETGISKQQVKTLHILAGGRAAYTDKNPDIYSDLTIQSMDEPMNIKGAETVYKVASNISSNSNIERPSKYYLPDAIYSVAFDIKKIMDERLIYNREEKQKYFNVLNTDIKNNIVFYEAVMKYTGETEETINKIHETYEKLLKCKENNENIVEVGEDGKIKIKDKFINEIDINNNNKETLDKLAILISFDKDLAINSDIEDLRTEYIIPYETNYASRENMLLAAFSLVGKVRYVWGGGHNGTSKIDGINPVWKEWENLYPDTQYSLNSEGENIINDGYNSCIKPSGSWCPEHGYTNAEFHGGTVYSADEYINKRLETNILAKNIDNNKLQQYKELMGEINYTDGINIHKLDGLDCSGYVSWIYNQITDKYTFDSTALYFNNQRGIQEVEFGSKLLPGDTFAWTSHIVMIVGQVRDDSKAYVTVEQTRNLIKFGVVYYSGASSVDIESAKQIANEANKLIGGVAENENAHVYCMNNVGYYTEEIPIGEIQAENTTEVVNTQPTTELTSDAVILEANLEEGTMKIQKYYVSIGRYNDIFMDNNVILEQYNNKLVDMTARDIIEYILTKLPVDYVTGYNVYDGVIFNKNLAGSNLGVNIINN